MIVGSQIYYDRERDSGGERFAQWLEAEPGRRQRLLTALAISLDHYRAAVRLEHGPQQDAQWH